LTSGRPSRVKAYGEENVDVAGAQQNLGAVLFAQSKLDDAERMERTPLATKLKMLGEAHPDVARIRQTLAEILLRRGRLAEARQVMDASLAAQGHAKNADPVLLAWSRNLMGQCVLREGHAAAAETLLVGTVEPVLGDPATAASRKRAVLKGAIEVLTTLRKGKDAARFQAQLDSLTAK
jgi:hypothetical protein